ncbi:DUF4225 domain-containing protein [Buttiauxella agrestis]|uniref:DUF4225 domain-containing protein n=1 Tax=Buttiauxella agrestis TaxID=82977 RepID=UPI00156028A5|nr:DUF4225 domain-containing protein [Buttiauxella agrestis]BCG07789.1 DUF4225 domain-containing protein [Buttiauxella agrestis]
MDDYLGSNARRDERYYRAMGSIECESLIAQARSLADRYIQDIMLRIQFVSSVESFARHNLDVFATSRNREDRKQAMQFIKEEMENLSKQDFMLSMGQAKIYATATFERHEKTISYIIDGIAIVLGGVQVISGVTVAAASLASGNVIGVLAGATLVLTGINTVQENVQKIQGDKKPTGWIREKTMQTAEFMGFDRKTGDLAYLVLDLSSSLYVIGGLFLKPEAWRLFHYLPTDFQRKITTMGKTALSLKVISTGNKIRVIDKTYTSEDDIYNSK